MTSAASSCALAEQTCTPCRGGVPPLTAAEIEPLAAQLEAGWQVVDHHQLTKTYAFPDFATALAWVNCVGEIAEQQGHHPDIHLRWGEVRIDLWTHKIDGLSPSDFILAAKCDALG